MTPEVKTRIEQIRRDEVPEGYKKGKLGIVPDEWENVTFSTLFTSTSDYTDDLDKYPLYSLTIEDGITPKTERYERRHLVKKEDSYKIVRPNDYAYNPMNLRFGAVARHKGTIPVAVSGYYDIFTTVHESDLPFMDSFLTCGTMITYYNRVSTGSLVEKQRVHFSQFLDFALPLPPVTERAKIAEILTTQDKVIELKEKCLAEKQRQKKYLMQQLLTGKKRLPGFSGAWKIVRLHQIVKRHTKRNTIGNTNVLTISAQYGLINQAEFFNKAIASDDKSNYFLLERGDFAYNKSYSNGYPFGAIKRLTRYDAGIVSPLYICFRIKNKSISDEYLEQYFEVGVMNHEIQACAQEGARNHGLLNITVDDFFNSKLLLPPSEEQTAIVQVLSTADRELDLLRQDIEQEKQKKKALMQLLLTGIVRVKK